MEFHVIVAKPLENNVYIVFEKSTGNAAVIDPAMGTEEILKFLDKNELSLELILNTHAHADHVFDNAELKEKTGAKLALHESDAKLLEKNSLVRPFFLDKNVPVSKPDFFLKDNGLVTVGKNIKLKVIHTPGHTTGSVCFFEEKQEILFSGDTLFYGTHGRTDLETGNAEQIKQSLKKLHKILPANTKIFPGHGPSTVLSKEKWIEEL